LAASHYRSACACRSPSEEGANKEARGLDRGEENLREVILFPMNQKAEDLMMGAPSDVSPRQLRELHIRTVMPE
jgi:hypothetical protein